MFQGILHSIFIQFDLAVISLSRSVKGQIPCGSETKHYLSEIQATLSTIQQTIQKDITVIIIGQGLLSS